MQITQAVKKILRNYEGENPGVKTQLARFLMHGRLGGTGKLLILAVDQGFEHGPWRSFAMNPDTYDPHYHYKLAIDARLSAYAAPLGWLEAGADTFAGAVPLILKMNSSNALMGADTVPDQAITASVDDALRLGCSAVGFTIYPSSEASLDMFEEISELVAQARASGLAVVIWSYPRGAVSKEGETAVDVVAYGAHMAALLGAHIIKVKPPTAHLETTQAKELYLSCGIKINTLSDRVRHVVQCCFNGRRLVIFSGMEVTDAAKVREDIQQIAAGGGSGSIIGRNAFKRPYAEAMDLLRGIQEIYRS
ncbi:MAG: class I fructose-bisphosphate aldolase [Alphaproteobacteria bacterium]